MHYLRCIHSIAPSGLILFFCPRGRHTLANLSPQPHWLRKQTGVFAKHLFHLWLYICNAKHLNEQLNKKTPNCSWTFLPCSAKHPDVSTDGDFVEKCRHGQ